MCLYECYKALWSKDGKSEAVSEPKLRRQAASGPGGLQDALKRHPLRSIGFREDRSPRQHDPGAV